MQNNTHYHQRVDRNKISHGFSIPNSLETEKHVSLICAGEIHGYGNTHCFYTLSPSEFWDLNVQHHLCKTKCQSTRNEERMRLLHLPDITTLEKNFRYMYTGRSKKLDIAPFYVRWYGHLSSLWYYWVGIWFFQYILLTRIIFACTQQRLMKKWQSKNET